MSLRLRLLIAVAVVLVVALIGADVATYSAFRSYLTSQVDTRLEAASSPLGICLDQGGKLTLALVGESAPGVFAELRTPSGKVKAVVPAVDQEGRVDTPLEPPALPTHLSGLSLLERPSPPVGAMTDDCLDSLAASPSGSSAPTTTTEPSQTAPVVSSSGRAPDGGSTTRADRPSSFYLTTPSTRPGQASYRARVALLSDGSSLVVALPLSETGHTLARLLAIEIGVSAAALLLALGLGVVFVRLGMKPLLEVEQTAEAIMEGDFEARVPERFRDATEMGRLTRVLNSMLGRISEDFERRDETEEALRGSEARMRQFLADASHELRTPLAAVSAYAELFSRGADSRPGDLARILKGIQSETGRMSRLVADLMLLASLDEGRPVERRPVELVAISADAVHAAEAMASEWPVELVATESVEVVGDETRLRQVVDNLLSNVRAHTPAGTRSTLRVYREAGDAVVELADHGPGLGDEGRRRVFERFFREDPSRTRASGGAGLGLAIVQAIVQAHGGSVEAYETPGGGATFKVRLPGQAPEPPGS